MHLGYWCSLWLFSCMKIPTHMRWNGHPRENQSTWFGEWHWWRWRPNNKDNASHTTNDAERWRWSNPPIVEYFFLSLVCLMLDHARRASNSSSVHFLIASIPNEIRKRSMLERRKWWVSIDNMFETLHFRCLQWMWLKGKKKWRDIKIHLNE